MKLLDMFNNKDRINDTYVQPYIIAEIGVNHEGSMGNAKRMVLDAKNAGANAVKFQTYKAETLASKHSPAYWDTTKEKTQSQFELFKRHDSFWKDEMVQLKAYCNEVGIEFMSTPFDVESAIFLNDLMDVFKISSSDITNKPFIEFICKFNKPIILSTGASNLDEIIDAVSWIDKFNIPLSLLHCVLNYPTPNKNANLGMIQGLIEEFPDRIIGYSDHTLPEKMRTCEIAWILGAKIIEKHFTFDKTLPGNDHYHSMDKFDLTHLRQNIEKTKTLLGSKEVISLEDEDMARMNARRSLVSKTIIKKGQKVETDHLTFKRPAFGVSPKDIDKIIGTTAKRDIHEDEVIYFKDFLI